jgi:hypothetical protein
MRKILLETQHIDKQAKRAAKRIATALDLSELLVNTSAALSSSTEMLLYIHDLQRENLELHFLVENPDFDMDQELKKERFYINSYFSESHTDCGPLIQKYSFDYFSDYYHPEFVLNLCEYLCTSCEDGKVKPTQLWEAFVTTNGFFTKEIVGIFGERVSDKGVI